LFYWAMVNKDDRHIILDVPCGLHKSTSLTCWAGEYADPQNRFVIVKPTLADCETQKEQLEKMGARSVGVLAGFTEERCKKGFKAKEWPRMYSATISPCRECSFVTECLFGRTLTALDGEMAKDIVVVTHRRYITLNQAHQIPAEATVVVDEALAASEGLSLDEKDWDTLEKLVPGGVAAHRNAVESMVADRGCHVDSHRLGSTTSRGITKLIQEQPLTASMGDSQVQLLARYSTFFKGESKRYVIANGTSHDWIKSIHYNDLPNRVVQLDGSARFSQTEWTGFSIVRLREHQCINFSNLVLHAHFANPTKRRMEADWEEYESRIVTFLSDQSNHSVFIAHNKEMGELAEKVDKLTSWIGDNVNGEHVRLSRGRIVGSNEASHCDVAVIVSSIFTSVSDYVLRCALSEGNEVRSGRIWKLSDDGTYHPDMYHGFNDPGIDLAFRRQYVNELYQTMMRIRLRRYDQEPYHVFAFISDYWLIEELNRIMCSYTIDGEEDLVRGFRALEDLPIQKLETISGRELQKRLGGSHGEPALYAKRNLEWRKRQTAGDGSASPVCAA
jgi:hypothetical protein